MNEYEPRDEHAYPAETPAETPTTPGVGVDGPAPAPMPTGGVTQGGGVSAFPGNPQAFDAWNYRADVTDSQYDLAGFHVEATDGRIGKVDRSSHDLNDGYLVVDTGVWIFGRKVVVPAGIVNHIDREERVVYLDRTKEHVKAGPDVDSDTFDAGGRDQVGDYYHGTYHRDIQPPSIR